jgi:dTMP kinase
VDLVREINETALGGVEPHRVFVIEVDPGAALARQGRPDRIGSENVEFQEAVRSGYQDLAATEPSRVTLLDGARPVDDLVDEVMEVIGDE